MWHTHVGHHSDILSPVQPVPTETKTDLFYKIMSMIKNYLLIGE